MSVHPSTKGFSDLSEICYVGRGRWVLHVVHDAVWPDPRSRSRSRRFESCENGPFQCLQRQYARI